MRVRVCKTEPFVPNGAHLIPSGAHLKLAMEIVRVLLLLALSSSCNALIERLYCGKHNCYELLEISRDASQADIRKAYRKQAMIYHPDKNKEEGSRERFELLATAYEVLKDEEERTNYDYMLDHPEEVYGHYYRYYRRRTPQLDIRWVVLVTVLVVSMVQYIGWWHSYQLAVSAALRMPQYRARAKELALSRGLLGGKRRGGREAKEEDEAILRGIVEENLNVTGGYSKPRLLDVLLFRIIFLPYTLYLYVCWYIRWVWLFNIKKQDYGPDEMQYLTRKAVQLSSTHWEALDSVQKEDLVSRQLWVKENLVQWRQEVEEEKKVRQAESSKHKMYRRYKKNH